MLITAPGCGENHDSGAVTASSLASLEEGKRRAEAGDFAAARESFRAAAEGGGLQPDQYCEARLQQAFCAARLGEQGEALALLDDLAKGAPDIGRVNAMRAFVKSRKNDDQDATEVVASPEAPTSVDQ